MLKKAKITHLLTWSFGLVIVLIISMAILIFNESSKVARSAAFMVEDVNPKVTATATIRLNIMHNWSHVLMLAQVTDEKKITDITKSMTENTRVNSEKYDFLQKSILTGPAKSLLDEVLRTRKEHADQRKHYLDLLHAGKRDEASTLLFTTVNQANLTYTDALGKLFDYESSQMVSLSQESLTQSGFLQTTNLSISALVILIALSAAVVVRTIVLRILGGDAHYAKAIAKDIATGNLSTDIQLNPHDTDSLLFSMKAMRDQLRTIVSQIRSGALQVGQSARELDETSTAVAAASAQQSEATSATAAAVQEMTVGIDSISSGAHQAKSSSLHSAGLSQTGSTVIHGAAAEMKKIETTVEASAALLSGLEKQSSEISAIVQVIRDIANQTNLLALNAAIEAARAGEQGRGFAVVADEVRKLAERTNQSTQQVSQTIEQIQLGTQSASASMLDGVALVHSGAALAEQAGSSIREIQAGSQNVADVVTDISNALQEQSKASAEIARNIEQIAQMVEANNSSAEQAATAAKHLTTLSNELAESIQFFRL